jgi:hypothetical protein
MRENDMANKISDAAKSKERVQVEEGMLRQALVLLSFLSYKIYQGVDVILLRHTKDFGSLTKQSQ